MQKNVLLIAYLAISLSSRAQHYPFVHYTPKDGLVSNGVRNIYQDGKGRMYFVTLNGLSVFDGERFHNYTAADGLANEVVNCVMEMGRDSTWIVTNTSAVNALVKGRIRTLHFDSPVPTINILRFDPDGDLYAGADDGLFVFKKNRFEKLRLSHAGEDLNSYITWFCFKGNYILFLRDIHLTGRQQLYVYDRNTKNVSLLHPGQPVINIAESPTGDLWLCFANGIREIKAERLARGLITPEPLPAAFSKIRDRGGFGFFDRDDNFWISGPDQTLTRCDRSANEVSYTTVTGLHATPVSHIFEDAEGTLWIASNGKGVDKMISGNLSISEKPAGLASVSNISISASGEELILFSGSEKKIARITAANDISIYSKAIPRETVQVAETGRGLFFIGQKSVFRGPATSSSKPLPIFDDTSANKLGYVFADPHGNLLISGQHYLTAIAGDKVSRTPIYYLSDQVATDSRGRAWAAPRVGELVAYSTHPETPDAYLKKELSFSRALKEMAPRSIAIDQNDRIWIGTRYKGILVFELSGNVLRQLFHVTTANGLTDNFASFLACDMANNIWVCTPSGLDKAFIQDGKMVIENVTRQNNIYQPVLKVVIDKRNTVWALISGGLMKITPKVFRNPGYKPLLAMTELHAGNDTLFGDDRRRFHHRDNSLAFHFAAPSFLDEDRVSYSYQLLGSSSRQWHDLGGTAIVSLIDLKPGNYTLNVKAVFPAGRYEPQTLSYSFTILPPWWQTWWSRSLAILLMTGLLIAGARFYYRRKLEKQRIILERKRAVEKERTRIATDMHDDLGAGLSRIKFISETIGIKMQQRQPFDEDISRIRQYSHEMIDKMGEIVWALNEKNDSLSDLLSYTRAYAAEYLSQNGIRCVMETPELIPPAIVSGEIRRNIFLVVKEALHNIVKHSQASNVLIIVKTESGLELSIRDDGCGFRRESIRPFTNGLNNMERRVKEIGGKIVFVNDQGTMVNFTALLPGLT